MLINRLFVACYEDGLDDDPAARAAAAAAAAAEAKAAADKAAADKAAADKAAATAGDKGDKTFTQDDVNRFLADDRRKHQERYENLETSYQELLQNQNLGQEERSALETQLEDLRARNRTKEQQLAHERKQIEDEWQDKYKVAEEQASVWETRFTEMAITNSLQAAAIEHDAYNANQVITQLRPQTKLEEQLDLEGKLTGKLVPSVEMTVKNEDTGVSEQLKMTPSEAVEYMKKNPEQWGNFFKNNIRDGIGSNSATGAMVGEGTVDHSKLSDEQWFALREKNPGALGLRPSGQSH